MNKDPFDLPPDNDPQLQEPPIRIAGPNESNTFPDEKDTQRVNEAYRQNNKSIPPPIGEAAFIGPLGDWVKEIEPYTECSRDNLLAQGLTTMCAMFDRHCYFYLEKDLFPNLFSILLGSSAWARKGTGFNHTKRLTDLVDPEWHGIIDNWQSGEAVVFYVRDGGTKKDPGVPDKRILVAEEELSHLFKAGSRPGSTLLSVLRQAWDCPHTLRNTTKKDTHVATDAFVSLLGHMTQEELVTIERSAIVNGLFNRCLFFYVARARIIPLPKPYILSEGLLDKFRRAFRFGFGPPKMDAKTLGESTTKLIPLSPDAQDWWRNFILTLSEETGSAGSSIARTPAQMGKVSLGYAILDCSEEIKPVHLEAAKAIVEHSNAFARMIFASFTPNKLADKILRYLRREAPEGKGKAEIRREVTGDHASAADVVEALQDLASDNLVRAEVLKNVKTGRLEEFWFAK